MHIISFIEIFWFFFLWINIYIVWRDIAFQKIENASVWILFALWCIWFLFGILSFSWWVLLWFHLIFLCIFLLFYFGIWWAGDAKYILVLSIFLPVGSVFTLFWNIAIVTLLYLIVHSIHLYIIKSLYDLSHGKNLFMKIYADLRSKFDVFLGGDEAQKYQWKNLIEKIFPFLIGFLIFFIIVRLVRIYALWEWLWNEEGWNKIWLLLQIATEYTSMIVLGIIIWIYIIYKACKKIFSSIFIYVYTRFWVSQETARYIWLIVSSIGLIGFISYEYISGSEVIWWYLVMIFSVYIFLYLTVRLLIYLHYVTFQLAEVVYKRIWELQVWERVDKDFLIQIFGTQKALWYGEKKWKYGPEPRNFFTSIENPLSQEAVKELQNIYRLTNNYHIRQKTPGFQKIEAVKTIKSFAFSPYIFFGLMLTLIYDDVLKSIVEFFIHLITS